LSAVGRRRRRGEIYLEDEERGGEKSFSTLAQMNEPSLELAKEGLLDEKIGLYKD
jgi:hypothetical protein